MINWGLRCWWRRSGGVCVGLGCTPSSGCRQRMSCPRLTRPEHPCPAPKMGTFGANWVCNRRSCHCQDQQLVPAAGPAVCSITCSLLHPHVPPKPQDRDHHARRGASLAPQHCEDLSRDCLNHGGPAPSSLASPKTHPAMPRWDAGQEETRCRAAATIPC